MNLFQLTMIAITRVCQKSVCGNTGSMFLIKEAGSIVRSPANQIFNITSLNCYCSDGEA